MKKRAVLISIFLAPAALTGTAHADLCPKDDELKLTRANYLYENGDEKFVNVVSKWTSTSVTLDGNARTSSMIKCTYSLYEGAAEGRTELVVMVPRSERVVLTNPHWVISADGSAVCERERRLCTWVR